MASKEVKMYSDYKSPFAYLAFEPGLELEKRYDVRVRWIPFQLRVKDKGERSLYSEYKTRYSYLDARRWAKSRGLVIRGQLKVYDTRIALIQALIPVALEKVREELVADVRDKVQIVPTVARANVELVFDPPWNQTMMSDEARLQTGMM